MDRAVHGRRPNLAAPGGVGRLGIGQLGPRHHRADDRVRHHLIEAGPGTVLLRARVPLCPRGGHGLCRCPCGLPVGHRGQARARAGELQPGAEARRGGDGRGLARPASHARKACRHQAHPALLRRGRACRSVGRSSPPIRARGPGDRPPPLAPYCRALRFRDRRRRRLLLRHGTARRPRCRLATPALRANPERAIYLLRQVCHSLSEAQSCGLVHRDIKPANIFLCRYGEEYDFVKVLDFGIVRAVRDSADTSPVHTRENAVQGTPAFIAPEQAMGTDLDGRADIYATGCVAYWLLTGQFVFTAETPMGLLVQHAQTPAAPPSARTDQPIPPALDHLVQSLLAKDPAQRPQSARELSLRLAEVEGASAWTQDRAREWWTSHQLATAVT